MSSIKKISLNQQLNYDKQNKRTIHQISRGLKPAVITKIFSIVNDKYNKKP